MAQPEYAVERVEHGASEYVAFFPTEREAVEHAARLRRDHASAVFKVTRLDRREVERYDRAEHRLGDQGG